MAKAKGQEAEGGDSSIPAKEEPAGSTRGGRSPPAGKAKVPGSKISAQKRSKQKPEAKRVAQGATAQPQKRAAGQKSIDVACQASDAAATIQLSPGAAPSQPLEAEHTTKAPKAHAVGKAQQNTEAQTTVERREGSAKAKVGRRKAVKTPGAASLQHLTRISSSSVSSRVSILGVAPDRHAEETASHSGTEEAVRSEPITQSVMPELTPTKPGTDAELCASQPGLISSSDTPPKEPGRPAQVHVRAPPLECLLPGLGQKTGPEQHHVKVCCALLVPFSTHVAHIQPLLAVFAYTRQSSAARHLAKPAFSTELCVPAIV